MRDLLSEFKLQTGYLKFREDLGRKETWEEAVRDRVMGMHRTKYAKKIEDSPKLEEYMDFAEQAYIDKLILGSQRALQFGGDPILKKNSKMYNCLTSYCDRIEFFREAMWWLLSGCGVGFSVQRQHIGKLPSLVARSREIKAFLIHDSIEGWADALGVLLASYFYEDKKFKDYYGYEIKFDFSQIRPKGAYISSGFKAPGPEPLKAALIKIEELIESWIRSEGSIVRPVLAYDILMHASNAVLAGGVRRSATICIFSLEDQEMLHAKTGNWFITHPHRARSNNSVALLKNQTTWEEFYEIIQSVKQFGEPGFVWLDDLEILYNPCVEIGMVPKLKVGDGWISGWQGCNLTTGNGAKCTNEAAFLRMCKALAILGTLQAGYTSFEYVGNVTEEIFRKEALLGCAISGWMNNPDILFDEILLKQGVELIKKINSEVAKMIGINEAARLTCSKPDGNSAIILGSASGIKLEESKKYIRYIQVNPYEYGIEYAEKINSEMFEKSVWDADGKDYAIGFAIENSDKSLFKRNVFGVRHLELVKKAITWWVEPGTRIEKCTLPSVRHNISNTITVDDWEKVARYIFYNRQYFAGISLLHMDGSLEYNQAPYSEVRSAEELIQTYGEGVMLASGLIVDGLHAFGEDLWKACMYVLDPKIQPEGNRTQVFLKEDWIRRARKFATNYFNNDLKKMTYCLKDVHRYYRFLTIKKTAKPIKWSEYKEEQNLEDIAELGAIACAGGACELPNAKSA